MQRIGGSFQAMRTCRDMGLDPHIPVSLCAPKRSMGSFRLLRGLDVTIFETE